MRVSTSEFNTLAVNQMVKTYSEIVEQQRRISTGERLLTGADDPQGAARAVVVKSELARFELFNKNGETAEDILHFEDSILSEMSGELIRAREITIQANNPALSASDKQILAKDLRQVLNQLTDFANTKDSRGKYIFSGFKNETQPITQGTGGHHSYNGDQGIREIQVGDSTNVGINQAGDEIFFNISADTGTTLTANTSSNTGTGQIGIGKVTNSSSWQTAVTASETYTLTFNDPATTFDVAADSAPGVALSGLDDVTYTAGMNITVAGIEFNLTGTPAAGDSFTLKQATKQDLFTSLEKMTRALEAGQADDNMEYIVGQTLSNLESTEDKILLRRAEVGTALNAVKLNRNIYEDLSVQFQETLSEIEDVDFYEAVSRLTLQQTALEAAQSSFIQIRQLSLFNFI